MISQGVHHVSFAVADLARAQQFYGQLLGLEEIDRPDLGLPGTWYRAGAAEIHLIQTPVGADVGSGPTDLTPLANHCAFAVEDYAKTLDRLKGSGLQVMETSPENGQMWLRDPDGNVIELISRRDDRA